MSGNEPIVCAHPDAGKTGRACEHLLKKGSDEFYSASQHFRFFTGQGADFVWICAECARDPERGVVHWRTICDGCAQDIGCGTRLGELGGLGVKIREVGLAFKHRIVAGPGIPGSIVAAAQRGRSASGGWLLLTSGCALWSLETSEQSGQWLKLPLELALERDAPLLLAVSADGGLAAIANTYGRRGIVVDLIGKRITMEWDRGDYHLEHCKFPMAFVEHGGRQLLVHATAWNRLDVSDPASGRLLTEREPTEFQAGQERPPHYLDYFQCSLSVSPGGDWIAGNGWVWHPLGVVTSWSLERWLTENVWESEDGQSKRDLRCVDYYWDGPLCWWTPEQSRSGAWARMTSFWFPERAFLMSRLERKPVHLPGLSTANKRKLCGSSVRKGP
jgi:hypothetical protein